MEKQILLLRTSKEIINKIRQSKIIPLPFDSGTTARNVGLCDVLGCRQLLKLSGGSYGQADKMESYFDKLSLSEYYGIIGTSKNVVCGHIEKRSPEMRVSPCLFSDYPLNDGQAIIASTTDKVIFDWVNYEPQVQLPKPPSPYTGLLARALAEI